MEEDRDQFYKDFISLTYEYSAKEIQATKGYILHGIHTDDIPVEWRVVTSSEYKATAEAENLEHEGKEEQGDVGDSEKELSQRQWDQAFAVGEQGDRREEENGGKKNFPYMTR